MLSPLSVQCCLARGRAAVESLWRVRDVANDKEGAFVKRSPTCNPSPSDVLCLISQNEARNFCQTDFGFEFTVDWRQGSRSRGPCLEALLVSDRCW